MNTETLEITKNDASTGPIGGETTPKIVHLKNILVPLDFSELSLKSLPYAVAFARQFGARLTLLHVIEPTVCTPELADLELLDPRPREAEAKKELATIRSAHIPSDLSVSMDVRHTFAREGVVDAAREIPADLIITTTHGYTGLSHLLLGSTAENVVRRAPCPVLVVRENENDFV